MRTNEYGRPQDGRRHGDLHHRRWEVSPITFGMNAIVVSLVVSWLTVGISLMTPKTPRGSS